MRAGDPLRDDVTSRGNKRCEYCQYPQEFSEVAVLQMNAEQPLGARRLLMEIGLYKDYIDTTDL